MQWVLSLTSLSFIWPVSHPIQTSLCSRFIYPSLINHHPNVILINRLIVIGMHVINGFGDVHMRLNRNTACISYLPILITWIEDDHSLLEWVLISALLNACMQPNLLLTTHRAGYDIDRRLIIHHALSFFWNSSTEMQSRHVVVYVWFWGVCLD